MIHFQFVPTVFVDRTAKDGSTEKASTNNSQSTFSNIQSGLRRVGNVASDITSTVGKGIVRGAKAIYAAFKQALSYVRNVVNRNSKSNVPVKTTNDNGFNAKNNTITRSQSFSGINSHPSEKSLARSLSLGDLPKNKELITPEKDKSFDVQSRNSLEEDEFFDAQSSFEEDEFFDARSNFEEAAEDNVSVQGSVSNGPTISKELRQTISDWLGKLYPAMRQYYGLKIYHTNPHKVDPQEVLKRVINAIDEGQRLNERVKKEAGLDAAELGVPELLCCKKKEDIENHEGNLIEVIKTLHELDRSVHKDIPLYEYYPIPQSRMN